jgi:alpha-glucosidase
MKFFFQCFVLALFVAGCAVAKKKDPLVSATSPDGSIKVIFQLRNGTPSYKVLRNKATVINDSRLGFLFKDLPALDSGFKIVSSNTVTFDKTWVQPWGEQKEIHDHYTQLRISLEEARGGRRKMNLVFRLFNDGIGFRYELPDQEELKNFIIMDELTEFALTEDFSTWWIPAYGDEMDSEYLYSTSNLSKLSDKVCTPLTMEFNDSLFVSIHEAALVDYAGMAIAKRSDLTLKCDLVPWANGDRVVATTPLQTPWRTIQITSKPGELISSYLILNLNEPNKLGDVSWIKPGKYTGIWWGMHMKRQTWEGGPNHGATTENVKKMIDFASNHRLSGVLAEGWNLGWEGDWPVHGNFSFTMSYPDFDLKELACYAKEKNVNLIAHHETGGNVANYERQLEDAFRLLQQHGIHYLKTGYVNKLPAGERHQGQFMVQHYHKVLETAARYKVMVDMHEPVKDTGLRRTYPNMMTREGVRGTEYEAWSDGNPPSHTTILPFTRGLSGPIDYTPGIFDILLSNNSKFRVHTTLAKQLALYVVIYSPLHMAADLPENYEGKPAFKFIEDVPTDWERTLVLNGKIGQYITTARKDRNSEDWFLGSITNEVARSLIVRLDFLDPGKRYNAIIYEDGLSANVETNPLPIEIRTMEVTADSHLTLKLAPGGGTAIRFNEIIP